MIRYGDDNGKPVPIQELQLTIKPTNDAWVLGTITHPDPSKYEVKEEASIDCEDYFESSGAALLR